MDEKPISAHKPGKGSDSLEQVLGYGGVRSEAAVVELGGSPVHDGLVHAVLHRQHPHHLLPVPPNEPLHQAEGKALGSSPAREKQVRGEGLLVRGTDVTLFGLKTPSGRAAAGTEHGADAGLAGNPWCSLTTTLLRCFL